MTLPRNADQLVNWNSAPRTTDSNATIQWSGRTAAVPPDSGSTTTIWGPGANAPSGVTWAYASYDGFLLPAWAGAHPGTSGNTSQNPRRSLFTESDSTNPTGTGAHLCYRYPGYSSESSIHFDVFPYPDYGGQAPAKFVMASFDTTNPNQSYRTLYMRFLMKIPFMSTFGIGSATTGHEQTQIFSSIASSGSGRTFVRSDSTTMVVNAFAGMHLWLNSTRGYPIASNTTTRLNYEVGWQNDYNLNGETYSVRTYAANSVASGLNAGIKWFFVNHGGLESLSTGSAFGSVWTLPSQGTLWINNTNLNDYVGLWHNFGTVATEGFRTAASLQQNTIWNGGLNADGTPIMNQTNFDIRPQAAIGGGRMSMSTNEWHEVEVIAYLNDSYNTNGRMFVWVDGDLQISCTTVAWTPKGFRMSKTTTVDGNTFEVYSRVTQPRWVSVRYDPTFGGGLRTPLVTNEVQYRAWYIGGVPATGND